MQGAVLIAMKEILKQLAQSRFRASFKLRTKERAYFLRKGVAAIEQEARTFIRTRLAPAVISNDGRQTPTKNHPVFIAQHATATCCRKCLATWHRIQPARQLSDTEVDTIVAIIMAWLNEQRADDATIKKNEEEKK